MCYAYIHHPYLHVLHDDVIKWKHFRVTGPLRGEFTGHWWIPLTKASDAELWCFLWSSPEQTVEQQSKRWWSETPSRLLWRHYNVAYIPHGGTPSEATSSRRPSLTRITLPSAVPVYSMPASKVKKYRSRRLRKKYIGFIKQSWSERCLPSMVLSCQKSQSFLKYSGADINFINQFKSRKNCLASLKPNCPWPQSPSK